MTEHTFHAVVLLLVASLNAWVGYLAYRVHRSAERIEGLTAATFLEARKALERSR
jgi:hypothetical protein